MTFRQDRFGTGALALLGLLSFGCTGQKEPAAASPSPTQAVKPTAEEVEKALGEASERDRQKFAGLTFEQFKKEIPIIFDDIKW
mgnify:CR=1 FL=1